MWFQGGQVFLYKLHTRKDEEELTERLSEELAIPHKDDGRCRDEADTAGLAYKR